MENIIFIFILLIIIILSILTIVFMIGIIWFLIEVAKFAWKQR
jgi:hypothetical protein